VYFVLNYPFAEKLTRGAGLRCTLGFSPIGPWQSLIHHVVELGFSEVQPPNILRHHGFCPCSTARHRSALWGSWRL
jgi:hypothetical protein